MGGGSDWASAGTQKPKASSRPVNTLCNVTLAFIFLCAPQNVTRMDQVHKVSTHQNVAADTPKKLK
jgi:hypothetical protein